MEPSARELAFLRARTRRRVRLAQIVWMQFRDLGVRGLGAAALLAACALPLTRFENKRALWIVASVMPVAALTVASGLGGARRHGMAELEGASRFSARLLRCVRLFVCGLLGLALCAGVALGLRGRSALGGFGTLALLGWPYLLTTWACMRVTRKVRGPEDIHYCMAAGAVVACLPTLLRTMAEQAGAASPAPLSAGLFAAALALTALEGFKYIKESEGCAWSLC